MTTGTATDPDEGRRAVIRRLLALCLTDRRVCELLDRHRDGLRLNVPPLYEIHRITCGTSA